ncbi:hypothetical protein [Candidatus Solirubrobacter pratensis]|uniref:hypothetical protein n=1 Tax=Candidatus Solirubrobacter pratensis TaxID=1298857 RepID=UPI0003F687DA|nr:hypothetical protein [Candidatus Solirubrobacter pratensis]
MKTAELGAPGFHHDRGSGCRRGHEELLPGALSELVGEDLRRARGDAVERDGGGEVTAEATVAGT